MVVEIDAHAAFIGELTTTNRATHKDLESLARQVFGLQAEHDGDAVANLVRTAKHEHAERRAGASDELTPGLGRARRLGQLVRMSEAEVGAVIWVILEQLGMAAARPLCLSPKRRALLQRVIVAAGLRFQVYASAARRHRDCAGRARAGPCTASRR